MRILIVGPSWVGDMVMAQSLFKILKQADPSCSITVLAPAWSVPVTARMPEVSNSVDMPMGHGTLAIRARWRLGRALRGDHDQAIVLPGSLKSALVPWFARIPVRTGFVGEQRYGLLNDWRRLDKQALPLNVQRVVALGRAAAAPPLPLADIPYPALNVSGDNARAAAWEFGLDPARPIVALCPGAEFGPAKQWPARHFGTVARQQIERGNQVMILGSTRDGEIASGILALAPGCVDVTGRTSLGQAIDLMSLATSVVSNDSGLMHIAAAVGCRVVALYGSSSSTFTPPLSDRATELSLDLDCQPCFQRTCPLGHLNCLNKLEPEKVIRILDSQPVG